MIVGRMWLMGMVTAILLLAGWAVLSPVQACEIHESDSAAVTQDQATPPDHPHTAPVPPTGPAKPVHHNGNCPGMSSCCVSLTSQANPVLPQRVTRSAMPLPPRMARLTPTDPVPLSRPPRFFA